MRGRRIAQLLCALSAVVSVPIVAGAAPGDAPAEDPDAPAEDPDAPAEDPDAPAEDPDAPAEDPDAPDDGPIVADGAIVTEAAERRAPAAVGADVVSVYDSGPLDASTRERAIAAAAAVGAEATVRHAATIGMPRVRRGEFDVQVAPPGYAYPMGTTVLEGGAVAALMGAEVAGALGADRIVMSGLTASLRGARAGDVVTLIASDSVPVEFVIGAVVDDRVTGGTELLVTPAAAARLGLSRESSVVIWNVPSRFEIDQALVGQGLVASGIRIRRSWDPRDPDSGIGMARTKDLLGEFAYRMNADGSVSIDESWRTANLPPGRTLLDPFIRIRARCHRVVEPALRAALAEVAAAGRAYTINVVDANRAGGCYNPRFSRISNSAIGFLSRHTWGQAVDTNTIGGCVGCAPPDFATNGGCETVRIFRKHGFAWGGNYLTPDGMHFEFVGESRHHLPYPSRYCPNIVDATGEAGGAESLDGGAVAFDDTVRATIFSDATLLDGFVDDHAH